MKPRNVQRSRLSLKNKALMQSLLSIVISETKKRRDKLQRLDELFRHVLWGPRDTVFEEDGTRYTDCQCGLFAISKQLRRLNVPFSYIENCRVTDDIFTDGLNKFLSVACMVKNFKNLEVTQVGTRLNPFKSVMSNELEITEKFGINISTMNMAVMTEKLNRLLKDKSSELDKDLADLKSKYDVDGLDDELLKKMLTFVYAYIEAFEDTDADVMLSECWTCMPQAFGANPCLAMSILYDMGYIVTCESDLHGAVSQALLICAARGKQKPLFGEFTVRNPINSKFRSFRGIADLSRIQSKKRVSRQSFITQSRALGQKTAIIQ